MSFFRYPGGKKKINNVIIAKIMSFLDGDIVEFREPFFGGGSVGIDLLQKKSSSMFNSLEKIWINDFDLGISCLWTSVIRHHQELKEKILNFTPSIDNFYDFQKFLLNKIERPRNVIISKSEMVDMAFKKIVIHQISYSGLGTMSGGPLGGRNQKSEYKVDCRWSPKYLCKKIDKINNLFKNYEIFNEMCSAEDFELLLHGCNSLIYLDPPYYQQGCNLYQHSFSEIDHIRLSNALKKTNNKWVLSYDDCKQIRDLYNWAHIDIVEINYSITGSRKKTELLIYAG